MLSFLYKYLQLYIVTGFDQSGKVKTMRVFYSRERAEKRKQKCVALYGSKNVILKSLQ